MKKHLFNVVLLVLIFTVCLNGQVRKTVLLEEATNASCGPCATNNPGLHNYFVKNFGNVISVRYHASWPGADPMYDHNTTENDARIQYYDISGVPNYTLDGTLYGVPSNTDLIGSLVNEGISEFSPIAIIVDANIDADSVKFEVTIDVVESVLQGELKLQTAIIERLVEFNGNNGEDEFPETMRKMLPDHLGTELASLTAGDSLTFNFAYPVHEDWAWDDLAVVAFVQSDQTKEVIQAATNVPCLSVESDDAQYEPLEKNQTYTKNIVVKNEYSEILNLEISFEELMNTGGWDINLIHNNNTYESFTTTIEGNSTVEFQLTYNTNENPGQLNLSVVAKNMDDTHQYGNSFNYYGVTLQNDGILVIDSDGGEGHEQSYITPLETLGVTHSVINKTFINNIFGAGKVDITKYDAIFWNGAWGFPAFSEGDISFLKNALDNGTNLFISGQDIGWDVFDGNGSSNFPEAKDFYNNYLDTKYKGDDAGKTKVEGVSNELMSGISFELNKIHGNNNVYPEDISSFSGNGFTLMKYEGGKATACIGYDSGTFKTIYMGVGLEQVDSEDMKLVIMGRALAWFDIISDAKEGEESVPVKYNLTQNYPNPFNPLTTIEYSLANAGKVEMKVFDMLGQEVAEILNVHQNAGHYTIDFDASSLSSGIYFYQLKTGDFKSIKKMMLLK